MQMKTRIEIHMLCMLFCTLDTINHWSSPGAGPYGCSESRDCTEEVAYGHFAMAVYMRRRSVIRAFDGNDRLLAKITALPIENLHVYLSVLIYILVRKFVSCDNLFF